MKVKNEEEARCFIGELRASSKTAQTRELRLAVENLELDQMYYEQKGNDRGVRRCEICLELLQRRLEELN